jgi:hypothetical protein
MLKVKPITISFLFVIILLPVVLLAQEKKKKDVWEPFKFFVGS